MAIYPVFLGSKLTRSIGWWLLNERPTPSSGLIGFLQEWDTAARILEHLFLAYVRFVSSNLPACVTNSLFPGINNDWG